MQPLAVGRPHLREPVKRGAVGQQPAVYLFQIAQAVAERLQQNGEVLLPLHCLEEVLRLQAAEPERRAFAGALAGQQ